MRCNWPLFFSTAYAPFVILGTLLASLVPVVGFNAVMTSEHFASFLVFILIHVVALVYYIKGILSPKMFKVAVTLVVSGGLAVCFAMIAVLIAMVASSPTMGWVGRSLSLLDPTYASKYIPIIVSVSEHQPHQGQTSIIASCRSLVNSLQHIHCVGLLCSAVSIHVDGYDCHVKLPSWTCSSAIMLGAMFVISFVALFAFAARLAFRFLSNCFTAWKASKILYLLVYNSKEGKYVSKNQIRVTQMMDL